MNAKRLLMLLVAGVLLVVVLLALDGLMGSIEERFDSTIEGSSPAGREFERRIRSTRSFPASWARVQPDGSFGTTKSDPDIARRSRQSLPS